MADLFKVDLKGLSNLLPHDGLSWIINELVQNAWDTETSVTVVTLDRLPNVRNKLQITVEDEDPQGFLDLAHSFTLFAKSVKLGDATKRGRFNLGEKLVIAYAVASGGSVKIESTAGGFLFSKEGRKTIRKKREFGSKITVVFKGTQVQYNDLVAHTKTLIPPSKTHFWWTTDDGETKGGCLSSWRPKVVTTVGKIALPTMIANEEGVLRRTTRQTSVTLYEPLQGDTPMLYEMGIPVVASRCPYHIDVAQKVPLNMQRDNVTPRYFQQISTMVLNATADMLTEEEVTQSWVARAMEDEDVASDAVEAVLDAKYGSKRVVHDPNNPEASAVAVAKGYTVVYGGNESKGAWENIRSHAPITSSSTLFETQNSVSFDPKGEDVSLPEDKWNEGMKTLAAFTKAAYMSMFNTPLSISYLNDPRGYAACFRRHHLSFNYRRIGKRNIDEWKTVKRYFLDLIIHEFAHREGDSHFSEAFFNACTKYGAMLALALLEDKKLRKLLD